MPASTPVILALDIGSSSIRASLYDHHARALPDLNTKLEREFEVTADGGSELDADEEMARLSSVIDDLLAKTSGRQIAVTHVAMCSFWHSLVGVDAGGRPTTTVLGWADRRSREMSAVLKDRFDETVVHDRTGSHFHSSFWPAKVLWLRTEQKDIWQRTARWLSLADHLMLKLCGGGFTSVSMASASGLFDQRKCDWDAELMSFLGVTASDLPVIKDASGSLNAAFARRWPPLKDAMWLPAVGDGAADHLGSCGVGKTTASLMVGTSAAMRVAFRGEPPVDLPPGLWSYRIDRARPIVGGALSDGGNLYRKTKNDLQVPQNAEDEIRRRDAPVTDIQVLPFFFGERSTGYGEDARGEIVGHDPSHNPTAVLQAAMEGVAFRLAEIYDRLWTLFPVERIVASGGALRDSPAWTQIIADVLGVDLEVADTPESASRGAVLLALERLGKIESIDRLQNTGNRMLAHRPEHHEAYKQERKKHQDAYDKTRKIS